MYQIVFDLLILSLFCLVADVISSDVKITRKQHMFMEIERKIKVEKQSLLLAG